VTSSTRSSSQSSVNSSAPNHLQKISQSSPLSILGEVSPIHLDVDNTITQNLRSVVGDISSIRSTAGRYFKSIHLWFPILSETSYYERLSSVFVRPNAEYSLLSLSMALITSLPPDKLTLDSFSSLYMLAKSSIAIVEAANINSLEVVQSRVLVSLFEAGHGLEPAAYISIAATTRAAVAIGLNKTLDSPHPEGLDSCAKLEEGIRVWWGIVMLDRYSSYTVTSHECSGLKPSPQKLHS